MAKQGNMPGSLPRINPMTSEVFAKHPCGVETSEV